MLEHVAACPVKTVREAAGMLTFAGDLSPTLAKEWLSPTSPIEHNSSIVKTLKSTKESRASAADGT